MADTKITDISQIKDGMFIKYVDKDDDGKFSHVGEVTMVYVDKHKVKKNDAIVNTLAGHKREDETIPNHSFEMVTFEGTMGFTVGTFENHELYITTTKPTGWNKFKKDPQSFKEAEELKGIPLEPVKTKKQQVFEIVAKNSKKKEKDLLKIVKKEVAGSDQQLMTYIKLALLKNR
jgi:hypothetical protein